MTVRHHLLDAADWWDRQVQRWGLTFAVGLIAAAFLIAALFVGNVTNEERCQIVAASSPSVATAPASPIPLGLQAGAPSHCEETP